MNNVRELHPLRTARLVLRPFRLADAREVQRLAGDPEVANATLLPHPYADGMAEAWIARQAADFAAAHRFNFAIERADDGALLGSIGLGIAAAGNYAKLGLWVGRPYWGRQYATEAARAVVAYGFGVLALERIWAQRFRWNKASGRVLEKLDFAHEGCRREFVPARGRDEIVELHGMLRWEWAARTELRQRESDLARAA
ncbi:MAG: GNAT family N-acetyltransferase [Burkholderiales bacterium]